MTSAGGTTLAFDSADWVKRRSTTRLDTTRPKHQMVRDHTNFTHRQLVKRVVQTCNWTTQMNPCAIADRGGPIPKSSKIGATKCCLSVALGDVNGDGKLDIITGTGFGTGAYVKSFDPRTMQVLQEFFAYPTTFTGGISVAAGSLLPGGGTSIVVGAGYGGPETIRVFRASDESLSAEFSSSFLGGVNVRVSSVAGYSRPVILARPVLASSPITRGFDGLGNPLFETPS